MSPAGKKMKAVLKIRRARRQDLRDISDIYNHYVKSSTCTYQEAPETIHERRRWFAAHGRRYPVIVAEIDGRVVGWGGLSRFLSRCAYRFTAEDSVYVRDDMRGRGIGETILRELIRLARSLSYHTMIASISAEQRPSIRLHRKLGFTLVGRLREVGFKFKRRLDVAYMQLMLEASEK